MTAKITGRPPQRRRPRSRQTAPAAAPAARPVKASRMFSAVR
jgi:hypothetical protein